MAGYKAGHIKRIKVLNFMTYDKEEIFPKSGLNLIIGLNGTGKSSIMCAICLGLGGKPQFTGRATQLSDFIKHGKQEAFIELELFKRPGKSVVICRTIKNKASTWTLNGKPSNQNEILFITGKLNIDTSNLCQFLPQEKVVEFSKMDKKQRLENMLKAIGEPQLVELFHNLKEMRRSYCEIEDKIKQIQNKKDENEQRNERLKPEIEKQNEREQLKSQLEILTLQRKCLEYTMYRSKYQEKKSVRNQCEKKKNALEKKKEDVLAKKEKIAAECKQKLKNMKQLRNRLGPLHSKTQKVVQNLTEISGNMRRSKIEYKNQIEEKENRNKKIEDLVLQIKGLEECYEKSKSQFETNQELFKALMQKSSELEAKHSELFQQTEQIKAQANKSNYAILQLEQTLSAKQKERNRELEKLKNISRPAYDGTCWLQENKHRFKSNVFTPIMFQIKVKRDEDRKYIENAVAFRDMLAFVCEDQDDAALLINVLKKEKKLPVNIVMTPDQPLSAFQSTKVTITDKNLGFQAFLSDLFTAPDAVMKYLCRVFSVHKIPVCKQESEQKMEHFLQKFNVFYTPTHKISGRRSKYGERCWSSMKDCISDKKLLASSETNLEISVLEEQIKAAKQEVDNLRNQYDFLNAQVSDIEKVIEKSRQEKQVLRDQQKDFERTASILKQKKQLLQTMKSNYVDETTLRLNVEKTVKTLAAKGQKLVKEQINLLKEILNLKKEEVLTFIEFECRMKVLEDVKKEVKEAEDEYKVAKDEFDEVVREYQQAESKARALLNEITPYKSMIKVICYF